jgi:hypothetical protein
MGLANAKAFAACELQSTFVPAKNFPECLAAFGLVPCQVQYSGTPVTLSRMSS